MFDAVFESLRKAADVTLQTQHEMFKKWSSPWLNVPANPAAWTEQAQKFPRKWAETVAELAKRQNELCEAQFKVGLRQIEETFRLGQVKDPEELRVKTVELWQKSFECLRQAFEAQTREFQTAVAKWTGLITKGAA